MNSKKSVFDTLTEMVISAEEKLSTILAELEKHDLGSHSHMLANALLDLKVLRNELRSVSSLARLARMIERQKSGKTTSTPTSSDIPDRIEGSVQASAPSIGTRVSTTEKPGSPTGDNGRNGCASSASRLNRVVEIKHYVSPLAMSTKAMREALDSISSWPEFEKSMREAVAEDVEQKFLRGDKFRLEGEETFEGTWDPDTEDGRPYYSGWGVMEFIEDLELDEGFALGNAIKYIARAGKKDEASKFDDLRKAVDYLNRYIEMNE